MLPIVEENDALPDTDLGDSGVGRTSIEPHAASKFITQTEKPSPSPTISEVTSSKMKPGHMAMLRNLQLNKHLNGKQCTLIRFLPKTNRWIV